MSGWSKLVSAEPAGGHRLRLTFDDGFAAVVDFADTVGKGGIYAFMRDPSRFKQVKVVHNGSALQWVDDDGDQIDFDADSQRMRAEANVVAELAHD